MWRVLTPRVSTVMYSRASFASQPLPYAHAKTGCFTQTAPRLNNPFSDDPLLERVLRRWLPQSVYDDVCNDLNKFGKRIVQEIDGLGREAELQEPRLEQLDAWGNRVDKLVVAPAWNRLKEICAEEGVIAIGYDESKDPVWRRVHQIAKLYMFSPSAGLVTCPMAMTDGAAKTLKELGLISKSEEAQEAYNRLTSRDTSKAWTSGQWMTEKRGGSDVGGGCDTYATQVKGNDYRLNGYKWFSSAIDADMALTLARPIDAEGNVTQGSHGLSLFYLNIRDPETKKLNGIQMLRLKNKLGTKQLPTAELLLDGTKATKLSDDGRGVACIANMLNITRIHNAVASVAGMRRVISLARDYATKREVFGRKQADWPLHMATLAKMEVETRGCLLLLMESARLLGLQESGRASPTEALTLRLITPVLKLYTGKKCVPLISEGIECFGGQGYMEDTGLPTLLRDAQVTPIWEGTTNVLSLDVLRVFGGKDNVFGAFNKQIETILADAKTKNIGGQLQQCDDAVRKALAHLGETLIKVQDKSLVETMQIDRCAREIAFAIARIYAGSLLTAHAADPIGTQSDKNAAFRFCVEEGLINLSADMFLAERSAKDRELVFENFASFASKL
uniref:Acyl-CoA dehydrogenase family member 11-like n=1 Tax=Steinernema glaseri TaxID=37863 RepID=A0A1I7ZLQ5_9BILA